MELEIRRADLGDLDLLMSLRMRVLREVFEIPQSGEMAGLFEANRRYYESEIPCGGHIACFARSGGQLAGCGGVCLYREMPSPDNPGGWCGYLMNIFTVPEFRGRGVGGTVVAWLIARAKEAGAGKIYLETTPAGKSLYRELGFEEMRDYLKLAER